MSRPTPFPGLLAVFGWFGFAAALTPVLLPPLPAYRTAVLGTSVLLFALALAFPRGAFILSLAAVSSAGGAALLFGASEPVVAGPIVMAGYFAGAALREIYAIDRPPIRNPLLPVWRAFWAVSAVSALGTVVGARTGYLFLRGVSPPREVNLLHEDAAQVIVGSLAVLAALAIAAGVHRVAASLSRDVEGRSAVDRALVVVALVAGFVGLFQKLGWLRFWRAERWAEWGRAQSIFSDPSAAGVAVALLVAPLLAIAVAGPVRQRFGAGIAVALLLIILADAGSRGGLVGSLVAGLFFVLWCVSRLAIEGRHPGPHRITSTVLSLAVVSGLAFGAALTSPGPGSVRSALLSRISGTFRKEPTPFETPGKRILLYQGALALFREHPVTGIGLGGFRSEFPNVASGVLLRPVTSTDHPPSFYLGTLVESGIAGAAILLLLLLAIVRGVGSALAFRRVALDEALRNAGAAAAVLALLVVFLFGSHIVYPEIAALTGLLTARLPLSPDGRTGRLLASFLPVALAGALVLLLGGVVAKGYETRLPESAFSHSETAGLYALEREAGGRLFRWTRSNAAWRIGGPPEIALTSRNPFPPSHLVVPMRNARPDGGLLFVELFWNDKPRGRISLPAGGWRKLLLPIDSRGVLRIHVSKTFRTPFDPRPLGIEVGAETSLVPRKVR